MASISQPLLGAGASAKNDWAHASAATSLTFTGEAQIRRGVEVAIGLKALATADAGLSRFIDATARGNAFAEATASLRYQLPLNLFDEFGLTIGAQAVAQAAAGIEVGLGLSIGDFVALLRQNQESAGLPIDLIVLLLDEAVVGGRFEVHVAAAAMAYASVLITGQVVKDPGFHVTVDAGLGLAAGVGFSGGLDLGIRDFRRFYGRAVDLTIASVVDGVGSLLPEDAQQFMPQLRALAPVAATALRVAYEIGDYIAKNNPNSSHQDALDLSNHCVGIILEEAQRFLFGRFVEAGLRSIEHLIIHDVPGLAQGVWNGLFPQRQGLANVLYQTPEEPFQPTPENAAYWSDLVAKTADLVAQLPASPGENVTRGMSILFAATELLTEAIRSRVNQGQAYAFVIGHRATTPPPPFGGALAHQPSPRIRHHINGVLRRSDSHTIEFADLVGYLVSDVAIAALREALPAVDEYLTIFEDPAVAGNLNDVVRTLLQNREAFIPSRTDPDPQAALRVLLRLLDTFITNKINQDLIPALNRQLPGGNVKTYFDEVLMGTLLYTKNVAFQSVLDWETHPVDQKAFTEALAAVMTMLLGRSLVLVGDGFMAALQADMQRACTHAASKIDGPKDPFRAIGIPPNPELKALLAETLRIGGEVFGPLPEETRHNLRFALYDVMETLPPAEADKSSLVENLADQFFIPNQESLEDLSEQLLAISRERFQLFVERVLEASGQVVLGIIEHVIQEVIKTVLKWAKDLDDAIEGLLNRIRELDQAIEQLIAQAQLVFHNATEQLEAFLERFSDASLRSRLRTDLSEKIFRKAKNVLADNLFYRGLPKEAKHYVKGVLKDLIDDMIQSPLLDPVFNAIGSLTGELTGMLDDVRDLNPDEALAPQLLDLVLDRMEDRIRDEFGGSNPRIDVGFTVTVFGSSQHFSLGNVSLRFSTLFTILRDAINDLSFYENELQAAAAALGAAFTKSLDLDAKQNERNAKHSDHDRLNRIRSEFTPEPKTVTIINPVMSVVYDDDIEVKIHLAGVPGSYLGLARDEQQRVLIFMNGDLIPPQSLTRDDPFASLDSEQLRQPIDVSRVAKFDFASNALVGNIAQIRFLEPAERKTVSVERDNSYPLHAGIRSLSTGRGTGSSRPVIRQSVNASENSPSVVTSTVANVLPGRRMTRTKRSSLEETLSPGTSIQFHVDRDHLVTGTNTLVVVVIDPGGHRYQQVASFGVTAPAVAGNDEPKLPALPGRKRIGRPGIPPGAIDLHFNRGLLANKVKKGQAFLAQHSAQLLKDFRKQPSPVGKSHEPA